VLQHRDANCITIYVSDGQPIEKEVDGARWLGSRGCGQGGLGYGVQTALLAEAAGVQGGLNGLKVGFTRERRIQGRQAPGRSSQQPGSGTLICRVDGGLRSHQFEPGAIERVEWSYLR
jgi:hypothetical protein